MRLGLGFTIACLMASAANADIRVSEAQYAGGILVVRGDVSQPGQTIILNNKFIEKSNGKGRFVFRLAYLPLGCRVDLVSGTDRVSTPVENCDDLKQPATTPKSQHPTPPLRARSGRSDPSFGRPRHRGSSSTSKASQQSPLFLSGPVGSGSGSRGSQ